MKGSLVLVLVVAFFVSIKSEETPGWELDVLTQQIDRLESNEITVHQELQQSKQLISELQALLEGKNEQFQQKISELTEAGIKNEEKHKSHDETHIREMEQAQTNQKTLEHQLKQAEQQTSTLQSQLESQIAKLDRLKQQVSQLTESSVKSEEKYQTQNQKLFQEIEQSKLHQKTLEQQLEQSKQQLQSKNATLVQLQQKVLKLTEASMKSEEKHQIGNEKLVKEIEQLKFSQTYLEKQLKQSEQQTAALQTQLQSKNLTLDKIQQQMSDLTQASVKSSEKHQTQTTNYEKLLLEMDEMKLNQKTYEQELTQSKQQTATLQAQLEAKAVDLVQLQRKVSQLTEASKICEERQQTHNKKHLMEMEQLTSHQQTFERQLEQIGKQTTATQTQLTSQIATLAELKQQVSAEKKLQINTRKVLLSSNYQWVQWSVSSQIPPKAVYVGQGWDDGALYVGRIRHNGAYFVSKVSPKDKKCYLAYGGEEISHDNCEILTGSGFLWQMSTAGSDLPNNAFPCGTNANGEPQYIGFVEHTIKDLPKSRSPGTIYYSDKALYFPFHTKQYKYSRTQLLSDYKWIFWSAGNPVPNSGVLVGTNWNKATLYVGRYYYNKKYVVSKVSPNEGNCFFVHGGEEYYIDQCEVLTGSGFSWVYTETKDTLPANAFSLGIKLNGKRQIIGRVKHSNSVIPGAVNQQDRSLSIPFAGREHKYYRYEVLVVN